MCRTMNYDSKRFYLPTSAWVTSGKFTKVMIPHGHNSSRLNKNINNKRTIVPTYPAQSD